MTTEPQQGIRASFSDFRSLLKLRAFYLVLEVAGLAVAVYGLDLHVAWRAVLLLIVLQVAFSLVTAHHYGSGARIFTDAAIFVQLLFDLLSLGAVLYVTGGATNAFVSLLLLPVAFAAIAMPGRWTYAVTVVAIADYSLLMRFHQPGDFGRGADPLHFIGMWVIFIVSALLLSTLLAGMARTVHRREQEIAEQRERTLRDEQVVAIGALAANAAHQLGTPLSSASLLLDTVRAADETGTNSLASIRDQLSRCREIVHGIADEAREIQAGRPHSQQACAFIDSVVERWCVGRPEVELRCELDPSLAGKSVRTDATLAASLMCMMDNGARAGLVVGNSVLTLRSRYSAGMLQIDVLDRGAGLSADGCGALGKRPVPSKEGMGVGLFLANASVERLGGRVCLSERTGGGVCCTLFLPVCAQGSAA